MLTVMLCAVLQVAGQKDWALLQRPEAGSHGFCYDARRDRLVMFTENVSDRVVDVWERVQEQWHRRVRSAVVPSWRSTEGTAFDPVSGTTLLFGGYERSTTAVGPGRYLGETWQWDGTTWTLHSGPGPSPRVGHRMAYDYRTNTILLIGGSGAAGYFSDLWEWNGQSWRLIGPGPTQVINGAAWAFDPVRGGMLLLNESGQWLWDGVAWRRLYTWEPLPRTYAAVATDWSRGRIVLHGGRGVQFFSDTWECDGTRWTMIDAGATMPPRSHTQMAYDQAQRRLVMGFGIAGDTGLADLWQWNPSRWQPLGDGPPAREHTALACHATQGVMVMFGGNYQAPSLGDTWVMRGDGWERGQSTLSPLARGCHAMVYDAVRQEVVMFGGVNALNTGPRTDLDDTWVWSQGQWRPKQPSARPSPRLFPAMAFDRARGYTVLFGGLQTSGSAYLGDTWLWDGTNWTQAGSGLLGIEEPTMTYDERRQRVVLYGKGAYSGPTVTREWNGVAWTASAVPSPHVAGPIVYDDQLQACLVIGLDRSTAARVVWRWDGTAWTQVGTHPFQFSASAACYDWSRQQVVVFGGTYTLPGTTFGYHGETWFLRALSLASSSPELPPGATATWNLRLPGSAGLPFVLGLSGGTGGIQVGTQRFGAPLEWPLSADRLFHITFALPSLVGVLDGQGAASVSLALPNDPGLDGLGLFASAVTLRPQPLEITPAVPCLVTR